MLSPLNDQSSAPPGIPYRIRSRYWAMSLRGYGERVCNLGNIFSGLSCTIDDRLRSVRTVRKPTGRVTDATRKRTWRSSEALAVRKRQLAPALRRMRPQECLARETGGDLANVSRRESTRCMHCGTKHARYGCAGTVRLSHASYK